MSTNTDGEHHKKPMQRKRLFLFQEKWCLFCYLFGSIHNILDLFMDALHSSHTYIYIYNAKSVEYGTTAV